MPNTSGLLIWSSAGRRRRKCLKLQTPILGFGDTMEHDSLFAASEFLIQGQIDSGTNLPGVCRPENHLLVLVGLPDQAGDFRFILVFCDWAVWAALVCRKTLAVRTLSDQ